MEEAKLLWFVSWKRFRFAETNRVFNQNIWLKNTFKIKFKVQPNQNRNSISTGTSKLSGSNSRLKIEVSNLLQLRKQTVSSWLSPFCGLETCTQQIAVWIGSWTLPQDLDTFKKEVLLSLISEWMNVRRGREIQEPKKEEEENWIESCINTNGLKGFFKFDNSWELWWCLKLDFESILKRSKSKSLYTSYLLSNFIFHLFDCQLIKIIFILFNLRKNQEREEDR